MVRKLVVWGIGALVGAVVIFALWSMAALNYVYSTGERAGFVQKFSKRGWIFKTWEGELALVNLPGAMPEIFYFTVRDKNVVPSVESTMGNRVVLTYNQHRGVPPRIFGDTPYFVNRVRPVVEPSAEPTAKP
ncbi:MAG: hypothetical protein IPN19_03280 [Elusimicrobia bacterium]|nr:hypothetical protein [Elusimicrobiota bacterium]